MHPPRTTTVAYIEFKTAWMHAGTLQYVTSTTGKCEFPSKGSGGSEDSACHQWVPQMCSLGKALLG